MAWMCLELKNMQVRKSFDKTVTEYRNTVGVQPFGFSFFRTATVNRLTHVSLPSSLRILMSHTWEVLPRWIGVAVAINKSWTGRGGCGWRWSLDPQCKKAHGQRSMRRQCCLLFRLGRERLLRWECRCAEWCGGQPACGQSWSWCRFQAFQCRDGLTSVPGEFEWHWFPLHWRGRRRLLNRS